MSEETQDSLAAAMSELSESEAAEASEASQSAPAGEQKPETVKGLVKLQPLNQGPPKPPMPQKLGRPPKPMRMVSTRYGCGDISAN